MCYLLWVWAHWCCLHLRCCCYYDCEDWVEGQQAESLDIEKLRYSEDKIWLLGFLGFEKNAASTLLACILMIPNFFKKKKVHCKDKLIIELDPTVIKYGENIIEDWIYRSLTTGEVCVSGKGCIWGNQGHCLHVWLHVCLHTGLHVGLHALETRLKSLLQLPLSFQLLGCTLEKEAQIQIHTKCC